MATMHRIGWKPVCMKTVNQALPLLWETQRGVINISETRPKRIAKLAGRATMDTLWKAEAKRGALPHLAKGCFFAPLNEILCGKDEPDWGPLEKGFLRCALSNGIWPQERLYNANLVESRFCLMCGEVGNVHHKVWICPMCDGFRLQYNIPTLCARTQTSNPNRASHSFVTRPLVGISWSQPPPPVGT